MSDFVKGVDIDFDFTNDPSEDFEYAIRAIYELTYKYQYISDHAWNGSEPKEDVLARAEAGIRQCAEVISAVLVEVFGKWLDRHAITDPETWAHVNYGPDETSEMYGDAAEAVSGLAYQYARVCGYTGGPSYGPEATRNHARLLSDAISGNIEEMPVLRDALDEISSAIHQSAMDEYISDGETGDEPEPWTADEVYDEYFVGDMSEVLSQLGNDAALEAIEDIARVIVFPAWFLYWKPKGIVKARKRVESAAETAKRLLKRNIDYPVTELYQLLDRVINTAHQTGSMTDYIDEITAGDTERLLNEMAESETWQFDEELQDMGASEEIETSKIAVRRQQGEARNIVSQAWADLALRETWGVEGNPKKRRKRRRRR